MPAKFLFCLLAFNTHLVFADSDVKFHGSMVVVQCQVNQDKGVNVHFDTMGVNKIDGVNFTQPIPFLVTCNNLNGGANPGLSIRVNGDQSDFNEAAVATNIDGLAIKIMKNGEDLELNTDTGNTYTTDTLTAVPVKKTGVELEAGAFHATATLVINVA